MHFRNIFLFFLLLIAFAGLSQDEKWKPWQTEADTLLSHEDFAGALKLYSKILDQAGANHAAVSAIFYKRAVCYYSLSNFASALKDLDLFIAENPDKPRARVLRAFVHKELGETDLQLEDLNVAVKDQPLNNNLLKWRASAHLEKGNYHAAKEDLLVVKANQDDPETEMYLGMAYYYEGHADSALLSLNKAIELDVTFLPPYLYACSYCLQENEFELVLKYVDVALKIEPGNKTALFYKGVALVELKREKEGCRCLTKALAAGEDDAVDYLKEYCYGQQ